MTSLYAYMRIIAVFICSFFLLSCSEAKVREYKLEVVAEYPHDTDAYTQGLFFHEEKSLCILLPKPAQNRGMKIKRRGER